MDKVAIKLFPVEKNAIIFSEIGQFMDIKFAYLNSDYEQVHKECKCRDFLGDIPWSRATGSQVRIYGMNYNFAEKPYDVNVTRFSLKFPRQQAMLSFIEHFSFLTDKEEKYGIPISVLYETNELNTLVIESSHHWQSNNWKLSLLTFYIKCMAYPELGKYNGPEASYISYLKPKREEILLKNIMKPMEDTIDDLSTSHNYSGFVALLNTDSWTGHPARKYFVGEDKLV
jgi:hypothetical protein